MENNRVAFNKKPSLKTRTASISKGWKMGFEPTTLGATNQCSNQLSYIHHLSLFSPKGTANIRILFLFTQNFYIWRKFLTISINTN